MALICLAAGGTGGHLFPAAALGDVLVARGHNIHLLTDARGLNYSQGFDGQPRTQIPSGAMVGAGLVKKAQSALAMLRGIWVARRTLARLRPQVLVGFGGYPSFPPIVAAWSLGIPTVLHEQNAVMGLANRHVSRFAKKIALSFDPTKGQAKPEKARHIGNPVRANIAALPDMNPEPDALHLLVFGGSLGATVMAEVVPAALTRLPAELSAKLNVTLQLRAGDQASARAMLAKTNLQSLTIETFLNPMADYLGAADLVICRSGATTVAEIAAAGRPAIFIPLDLHRDAQQSVNAANLADQGAALIAKQQETSAASLADTLKTLLSAPQTLTAMGTKARSLAKPRAAQDLADLALSLILDHAAVGISQKDPV